jgi:hypothetical protein
MTAIAMYRYPLSNDRPPAKLSTTRLVDPPCTSSAAQRPSVSCQLTPSDNGKFPGVDVKCGDSINESDQVNSSTKISRRAVDVRRLVVYEGSKGRPYFCGKGPGYATCRQYIAFGLLLLIFMLTNRLCFGVLCKYRRMPRLKSECQSIVLGCFPTACSLEMQRC